MNEDEMQVLEPQAGETLERTLARYARVRLDPGAAESKRVRAAVMEEAWRRRLDSVGAAIAVPANQTTPARNAADPRGRHGPFAAWGARRISASLAAAVVAGLLIGTTAFASSRAGGPLYEARLAVEELALPADAASRVEVEISWAQARLAEIVEASSRNDQGALTAALTAYGRTIDTLGATTGDSTDRALEAVASHRAVLARVEAAAPASALGALERALANSEAVMDHLATTKAARPGGASGGGNPGGLGEPGGAGNANGGGTTNAGSGGGSGGGANANGGGTTNAGSGANPNGNPGGPGSAVTPKPEPTPKPDRTPAPRPTKAPDAPQHRTTQPASASPSPGNH